MKPRLLLVEDDPGLIELLKWHLEREAFDVSHTPTARKR
jgi:two-component system phosphate regulon response regulator PhoB